MIRAWRYVDGVVGHEDVDIATLAESIDPEHAVVWIDTDEPANDQRAQVVSQLGIAPLVVEALMNPKPERTKLIRYGDYFHVAVHDCELRADTFESGEIDVVVGPGWMVTVRHPTAHSTPVDVDDVTHRFELQRSEHSKTDEGFLLWALFDVIIDRYFDVIDAVDDRLDNIEEGVFRSDGTAGIPQGLFVLRRELMQFRRAAAPMREVVDAIGRKEVPFVHEDALIHFRDLYDRTLRVLDFNESQRDLLAGLLEADLAVISNKLNDVMKKVTSWGAILVSATLIAGIYGMNFRHMPELGWSFGYPLALGSMVLVMGVLYLVFKKKDWL
jgi:magnesium transporter